MHLYFFVMKRILLFLAVVLFQSCDYAIFYEYKVTNDTDQVLDMVLSGNSPDDRRAIHIQPHSSMRVYIDCASHGGKFDIPGDLIREDSLLPSCRVYEFSAAGRPIPEHFRQRRYWNFEASIRLGVYTLTVVPAMMVGAGAEDTDL